MEKEPQTTRRAFLFTAIGIGLGAAGLKTAEVLKKGPEVNPKKLASSQSQQINEPTPSLMPEPTKSLEPGENPEVPFPYFIDGWKVMIEKAGLKTLRTRLDKDIPGWNSTRISTAHVLSHPSSTTGLVLLKQNYSPNIFLVKSENFGGHESSSSYLKDGFYHLPTSPIGTTYISLETRTQNQEGIDLSLFKIDLETKEIVEKMKLSTKLDKPGFEVLFEGETVSGATPKDIFLHGVLLDNITPSGIRSIIVPQDDLEGSMFPTYPDSSQGIILTIPSSIQREVNHFIKKEHPALIRMTKDTIGRMCRLTEADSGRAIQDTLKGLQEYIQKNQMKYTDQNADSKAVNRVLNIESLNLYDVKGSTFGFTQDERSVSRTHHAERVLINFIPVLMHKHARFEKAYDALTTEQKRKADGILTYTFSLLSELTKSDFDIIFPENNEMLEKRGLSISDLPDPSGLLKNPPK